MATSVIFQEQVEIPLTIRSLAEFRRWALSEDFPERGRIDYVAGRIEVDMQPEDLFCHGTLKTEIVGMVSPCVKRRNLGYVFTARSRVSCPQGDLSVEPDGLFVSHEALDTGRVRLIPAATHEPGHYIELEGPPDLIVEIVSDSSVGKDTRRLPEAYFKAGVREFWLADARKDPVVFRIHQPGEAAYVPEEPDAASFQTSAIFGCSFRLDSRRDPKGHWVFDLRDKPLERAR
ncbi:MAG TPA: Uma2 family endonuclease [Thermoguttaceae bacterium]|nr:Uma2 family endonuclease [Thermoguttaceae bacterium]